VILQKFAMNWWKSLKGKVKLKEPLKDYTTFKIGGRAEYFVEPKDLDDLKLLLNLVKRYLTCSGRQGKIPILVIGAGSNILISDKGLDGIVLRLNSPYFKRLTVKDNRLKVGAGCLLNKVILKAKKEGLSGMEELVGIPGSIGGALAMNAGTRDKNIADSVENVTVMDYNGKIKTLDKKDIRFGYRSCGLSRYIILNARIRLVKKNKKEIQNRINDYLKYRKSQQDLSKASAGCVFKNPRQGSAGKLIDLCGLKGKRIGGATVSKRHANFIVNLGQAKAQDVIKLMTLVKKEVKNRFKINLEPEIKIWQ